MKTALLIDADKFTADILKMAASTRHCELIASCTVSEAEKALSEWDFPLVIADAAFGKEIAEIISRRSRRVRLCIISENPLEVEHSGDFCITKPFNLSTAYALFDSIIV